MIDLATTELVNAIAIVESGARADAPPGDGGRAISMFQIHEGFWLDCYNWQQRKHGKQIVDIGGQWADIGAFTPAAITWRNRAVGWAANTRSASIPA